MPEYAWRQPGSSVEVGFASVTRPIIPAAGRPPQPRGVISSRYANASAMSGAQRSARSLGIDDPLAHRAATDLHPFAVAGRLDPVGLRRGHFHHESAQMADEGEHLAAHAQTLAAEHRADVDALALEVLCGDRIEDRVRANRGFCIVAAVGGQIGAIRHGHRVRVTPGIARGVTPSLEEGIVHVD